MSQPPAADGPESPPAPPPAATGRAWLALGGLAVIHMLTALDRWGLVASVADVRRDLGLDPFAGARFESAFLAGFVLACPLVGWLGDRARRTRLMALGLGLWGLAALGAALARTDGQLATARAPMGAGAAIVHVVSLTLLADLVGPSRRATAYALWMLGLPLGVGLASALPTGWRTTTALLGVPGLAAAAAVLFLRDPVRGATEGIDRSRLREHERAGASQEDYIDLSVNSSYTYSVFGLAALAFAAGGLASGLPDFLAAVRGLEADRARWLMRGVALAAALGLVAGGWACDRLARSRPRAPFVMPALAMLAALPALLVGLLARPVPVLGAGLLVAAGLMAAMVGPALAIIASVATPNLRAGGFAAALLATHLLGGSWSPALLGRAAEYLGEPETMATPYGRALAAVGAEPVVTADDPLPRNLLAGLLAATPALPIAVVVLLAGARHLPRERALMRAKLRAAPVAAAPARRRARGGPRGV